MTRPIESQKSYGAQLEYIQGEKERTFHIASHIRTTYVSTFLGPDPVVEVNCCGMNFGDETICRQNKNFKK